MEYRAWSPAPQSTDTNSASPEELLVTFDHGRAHRILILPALFDEANKLRRFTLSVMRALDEAGIDSALPDWPGCNESIAALPAQTLSRWRACAAQIASDVEATHILAIRAGALLAPPDIAGWRYAALEGPKLLAGLLRAQTLSAREAGRHETRHTLLERGREHGLTLAGWDLGPNLVRELETAALTSGSMQTDVDQGQLGGSGLWLRAEPGEDEDQSETLAALIAKSISQPDQKAR